MVTIFIQAIDGDTGNTGKLSANTGLALANNAGTWQIQPASTLGSVQALASNGLIAYTGSNTVAARSITSASTITVTNPTGAAGDINLDVIDNTSIQKIQVAEAGTVNSTRDEINFIAGSGMSVTVADNGVSGRADITLATTSVGSGAVYYDQSFAAGYPTTLAAGAIGAFNFSTPSAGLLALLTTGGAGTLVVVAHMEFDLVYTGTLPAVIPFDIATDVNAPSPTVPTTWGQVISTTSTASTTSIVIAKPLSDIFDGAASNLVLYVQNPDSTNSLGLNNLSINAQVYYLPNGFGS